MSSVCGDLHRRRQDARDSGMDVASFDHADISAEVGMFNKKLKFKVLVSHRSLAVAAWKFQKTSPNPWSDSSVICWRRRVLVCMSSSVKTSQQRTRQFRTIPRNTPRYSHGSLGHRESAIKEVKTQMRATLFQMYADYNRNSDKFPA